MHIRNKSLNFINHKTLIKNPLVKKKNHKNKNKIPDISVRIKRKKLCSAQSK